MAVMSPADSAAARPSMTSLISCMSDLRRETLRPGRRNRAARFAMLGERRRKKMKYLILIQSNPRTLEVWEQMTEEQRIAFGRAHQDLGAAMLRAGVAVASE